MPPQLQALLQDRRVAIAIIAVVILAIGFTVFGVLNGGGKGKEHGSEPLDKDQKVLASINGYGKAIEIQALLARQGIQMKQDDREGESKIKLVFPEGATQSDRDKAMITLVQSGLMDKNIGLESFDKGDLTASREEKRIKLIRAQQGELARLIRKIDPIEDAAVTIAIPEQTLFRSEEKAMSAAVQVSLPVGTSLTRDKVRAISNLMVGSIQGLDVNHLSLSDTNGNTYNSVLGTGSDLENRLQEQDAYMKQKVASQLDRLVGAGNYVVTVSTELREAPRETLVQSFDPQGAVVSSKQSFNENMNAGGAGGSGGPASSFLPNGLNTTVNGGASRKDYLRNGVEVTYNNSRTQWVETQPVGMVEDISIAVTIDAGHFPANMSINELQTLLASAASPKVRPENVNIAKSNKQGVGALSHTSSGISGSEESASSDMSWLWWAGGAIGFCVMMILLLSIRKGGGTSDEEFEQTQRELAQLRDLAGQQQAQLQATQQQTQMLLEAQQRQMQQSQALEASVTEAQKRIPTGGGLQQTLEELREVVSSEDLETENLDLQIKSWIESS